MLEILFIVVIVAIYYTRKRKYNKSPYKAFYNLPGPIRLPIIGTTYYFLTKILNVAIAYMENYGPSCIVYIPHRTYMTSVPEELKIILNHPNALDKSREYDNLIMFKNTLLVAKTNEWRKNRKLISKGFNQAVLDMFLDTFYKKSISLSKILRNGSYNDLYYLFEKFTLDVFFEATIGIESTILEDEKEHMFVTAVTDIQNIAFNRIGNLLKTSNFLFSFFPEAKKLTDKMNDVNNFIRQVIKTKREQANNESFQASGKLPVMDLLLQNSEKENLTDHYIRKEITLFAGAATDTTAYTIGFTLCLLAMHPKIQEKVYDEIIDVVGNNGAIECNDLSKLVYTDMAIKESQRIFPSVPLIGRQANDEIRLGDKTIPPNTGIVISFFHLHRNPDIYPNPLEYNPDRFLPEEVAKRPNYSFLPFSGGPRNCIGLKYASMLLKTVIATVVRDFKLVTKYKSVNELDLESHMVMRTTHPLDITFIPRGN
ncbi:cytochrome P450 4C1 isoform X2 [Aethina tumida]|uniref:cytochrome P450 4C1 isoform X2 n=1 Tax=Aethina tumida TaxID=116153 RepID=UPI00096AE1A8|nr:cytochrome P450 4C1 isoform X2 [Aethina tumida]